MAENKARGYGLSAEVQRKINANYNKRVEEDVRRWIENVLEEPVEWGAEDTDSPGSGFADGLMDGEILCKLANKLQPGAVKMNDTKKVTNAAMRTNKEKENIEKFLKFAEAYGVKDRFTTAYLYQKQNVMSVVNCLCQLGSTAQSKGFSGPCLGPKIAEENKRNFTEEQLCEGKKHIGLQMGTNKLASQAGEHFGRARQVAGVDAYK